MCKSKKTGGVNRRKKGGVMAYFQDNESAMNFKRSKHGAGTWISNHLRLQEEWRKRDKKFDLDDLDALEEEKTLEETEELNQ